MLFLLSPAKSLDYATPLNGQAHTAPLFVKDSKRLIEVLRSYSPAQISELMGLSDKLSTLNVARYQAWSSRATEKMPVRRCWPLMATSTGAWTPMPWRRKTWPGRRTIFVF